MTRTTEILKLPALDIAFRNFATCFVAAGNRRFALYQVDHVRAFWVVELGFDDKPAGPARRYYEHSTALECLIAYPLAFFRGRDVEYPAEG